MIKLMDGENIEKLRSYVIENGYFEGDMYDHLFYDVDYKNKPYTMVLHFCSPCQIECWALEEGIPDKVVETNLEILLQESSKNDLTNGNKYILYRDYILNRKDEEDI